MVQSSKSVKKKAAKKKTDVVAKSGKQENPVTELLKAIMSGRFGPVTTVQRVQKWQISEDLFAQSVGRIAEKIIKTDERIDRLAEIVEQSMHRGETCNTANQPHIRNEDPRSQPVSGGSCIELTSITRDLTLDDSIQMLAAEAAKIADYVKEHKIRYAGITNQVVKEDVRMVDLPPAACELQAFIHTIVHTLALSNAELRDMLSRCLV